MEVFVLENTIMLIATLVLFAVKAWAFIDALGRPAETFTAADKMTKKAWLLILGIFLGAHMVLWGSGPISLLNIVGTVAAFVYILDVRPAVKSLTRR